MDSFNKLDDELMPRAIKCASDGQSSSFGQQKEGSKLVTSGSKSTKKHFVEQAIKSLDKKDIAYNTVDVFIDLESTSIDIGGALTPVDNINDIIGNLDTKDSKYLAGDVTIYVVDSLDLNIARYLLQNDVVLKYYYRRKAVCNPCRELIQEGREKPKLMEFDLITDIAWSAWEIERGLEPDKEQKKPKPIMIISNDHYSVAKLANELARDVGFTVIRTLPTGMRNESMYKQLTQDDEISWILTRRLHRIGMKP